MARQFLLLPNTRAVIQAEQYLKIRSIPCKVMPVPRALSSECGMCLEVTEALTKQQQLEVQKLSSATWTILD